MRRWRPVPILTLALLASGCTAPELETRLGAPCGPLGRTPRLEGDGTRLPGGTLDCAFPSLELPPPEGFGPIEDRARVAQALEGFRLEASHLGRGAARLHWVAPEAAPWRLEVQVLSLEVVRRYRVPAFSGFAEHVYRLELRCRLVESASGRSPWGCTRAVAWPMPLSYPPDPAPFLDLLKGALRDCGAALARAGA